MRLFIKSLSLLFIIGNFGYCALTLTVDNAAVDLGNVSPADGFYGSPAGNIKLVCETNSGESWNLNASISQELTNSQGYSFNSGSLKWKGYSINHGNFTKADWSSYPTAGEDTIAMSDGTVPVVNVLLGTLVYIPSVMPEGDYQTTIIYTLTN